MNRNLRWIPPTVALLAVLGSTAHASDSSTGGAAGSWLMNYSGARTLGMGGAFVATADDALGILWNPAGLQRMDQNQLMFENVRLFEDTSINSVSFAVPASRLPSLGVSMVTLHSSDFQRTDELNGDLGSFSESETAYLVTFAKSLSHKLAIGTNIKVVQQSIESFSGGGFGLDLGALFEVNPLLHLGFSAANLGGPKITLRDNPETYPMALRGGIALGVLGGRGLISAEADYNDGGVTRFHGGSEFWIQPGMALRVGVMDDRATGGFSYRFLPQYQLDYAVADHPLGLTHRVGMTYRFGGFFASSQAQPEMFSPTGEQSTTKINLNARTKTDAKDWALEIVGKNGAVIRRFSGPGLPPPHVQWDGKDETGLPVADGIYSYRLVVNDKEGRALDAPLRRVTISTGGPQGQVPVTTNP